MDNYTSFLIQTFPVDASLSYSLSKRHGHCTRDPSINTGVSDLVAPANHARQIREDYSAMWRKPPFQVIVSITGDTLPNEKRKKKLGDRPNKECKSKHTLYQG